MRRTELRGSKRATQLGDARRALGAGVVLVCLVSGWIGTAAGSRTTVLERSTDAWQLARSHRPLGIPLPDGSTLLLRREYRAFYRALAVSQDGLVLGKAYHAARSTCGSAYTEA